jgi:hypothetical protein
MRHVEELDSGTIGRLNQQSRFLLNTYQYELGKDPASRATECSRSNVIALRHTIRLMYGEAVARDLVNLI